MSDPDPKHISTSFVERQNLTMRMQIRRFTRLATGFSKKVENHAAAVALHFMHHNFCRIHKTSRVTPAMEAGLTGHVRSIEELVALMPEPVAKKRGRTSHVRDSMAAMNKRKSSRITGLFVILFGVMRLLNSLNNPRLAAAHGSDLLQLIAVGLCFGVGALLLAGLFRFPGE